MIDALSRVNRAMAGTVREEETQGVTRGLRVDGFVLTAFFAGLLAPFSVNVVGQMPLGEIVLFAIASYVLLAMVLTHRWPNALLTGRPFRLFMTAQAVAFGGYIFSDLMRGSSTHDLARGWARMAFLAIDVFAMAFLAGTSRRCLVALIIGWALGNCLAALVYEPLFGDYWKFGFGGPITRLAILASAGIGVVATQITTAVMGCIHLAMDFRSLGAQCILVASLLAMLRLQPRIRIWVMPICVAIGLLAASAFYQWKQQSGTGGRASRSNIERSAMMAAAWQAFVGSPFVGSGSWFSNTNVMDNFLDIRTESAWLADVGGFTTDEVEEGLTLHSQILVGLAEGGLAGGCFFFCYGAGLLWAIGYCAIFRKADGLSGIYLLTLSAALSNLFFSPFSGEHRIAIALAAGIVLQLWQEWRTGLPGEAMGSEQTNASRSDPSTFASAYER